VKFNDIFLEKIKHPIDEPRFDVFRVVEEWPNRNFEIPIPLEDDFPKDVFTGNVADLNEYEKEMWSRPGWGDAKCPECGTRMQILDSSVRECLSCYLLQVVKKDGSVVTRPEGLRK